MIELVQEQINNKLPADVRQLLTGVHYNVLGYDESDKLRPVGSLDAITKIAQVYLLEVHRLNVSGLAAKTVDHAIQTEHGMAKMTTTLKEEYLKPSINKTITLPCSKLTSHLPFRTATDTT